MNKEKNILNSNMNSNRNMSNKSKNGDSKSRRSQYEDNEDSKDKNLTIQIPDNFDRLHDSKAMFKNHNQQLSPPSLHSQRELSTHNSRLNKDKGSKGGEDPAFDEVFQEESKRYLFGLNGYTWASNYRTVISGLTLSIVSTLAIGYILTDDIWCLRLICICFGVEQVLLIVDYVVMWFSSIMYIIDLLYCLVSIAFWVRIFIVTLLRLYSYFLPMRRLKSFISFR